MSGEFPFAAKIVSPLKCNEKPWDLWADELGRLSPRRDDDGASFTTPAAVDSKGSTTARRLHESHPYKSTERQGARYRRAGVNRLRQESMSLHGLFPQMDNLNAAVCHMCGVIVKCSAAYRHLLESHTGAEPILPPPPPTVKLKSIPSRSRHKKEPPPPVPIDINLPKLNKSPVHSAPAPVPISRIVVPPPDLQYVEEAATSALTTEVQVSMESGELPVVSIQDTEELPLGENITDDIFEIMNSEGIQSADDITNAADWKNIIRDIGNMQEINFSSTPDTVQSQDLYQNVNTSLAGYSIPDTDLSSIQFAPSTSPMLSSVIDNSVLNAQALKPAPTTPKSSSRKSSKSNKQQREYDPNKHCGVVTAEKPEPCTRSLTCKAHALSLRRTVEGRAKPFDTLLAEHRAAKESAASAASAAVAPPPPVPLPPLLVNTPLDVAFNGLSAEQQVNDIYQSLLSVEDPVLPDTSGIASLLLPDEAELAEAPLLAVAPLPLPVAPAPAAEPPAPLPALLVPADVCWYAACPRPLALCTFNASHAGGAVTLGKKFATVRSNIKSSLSRSTKPGGNSYYQGMLSKTLHMNSKANKPEVRKLVVSCSGSGSARKEAHAHAHGHGHAQPHTLSELFGATLNGHAPGAGVGVGGRGRALKGGKRGAGSLDLGLGFSLDPLLADEKC